MCDDLGIDNTKIKTYRLTMHTGSDLIDTSLDGIIECLKIELQEAEEVEDEPIEYAIIIEKKYTQKELDEMGEFDGF